MPATLLRRFGRDILHDGVWATQMFVPLVHAWVGTANSLEYVVSSPEALFLPLVMDLLWKESGQVRRGRNAFERVVMLCQVEKQPPDSDADDETIANSEEEDVRIREGVKLAALRCPVPEVPCSLRPLPAPMPASAVTTRMLPASLTVVLTKRALRWLMWVPHQYKLWQWQLNRSSGKRCAASSRQLG